VWACANVVVLMPMAPKIVEQALSATQRQCCIQMLNILEEELAFPGCRVVRADAWTQGLMAACTFVFDYQTRIKTHSVFCDVQLKREANPIGVLWRWQERMMTYLAHLASH